MVTETSLCLKSKADTGTFFFFLPTILFILWGMKKRFVHVFQLTWDGTTLNEIGLWLSRLHYCEVSAFQCHTLSFSVVGHLVGPRTAIVNSATVNIVAQVSLWCDDLGLLSVNTQEGPYGRSTVRASRDSHTDFHGGSATLQFPPTQALSMGSGFVTPLRPCHLPPEAWPSSGQWITEKKKWAVCLVLCC